MIFLKDICERSNNGMTQAYMAQRLAYATQHLRPASVAGDWYSLLGWLGSVEVTFISARIADNIVVVPPRRYGNIRSSYVALNEEITLLLETP